MARMACAKPCRNPNLGTAAHATFAITMSIANISIERQKLMLADACGGAGMRHLSSAIAQLLRGPPQSPACYVLQICNPTWNSVFNQWIKYLIEFESSRRHYRVLPALVHAAIPP